LYGEKAIRFEHENVVRYYRNIEHAEELNYNNMSGVKKLLQGAYITIDASVVSRGHTIRVIPPDRVPKLYQEFALMIPHFACELDIEPVVVVPRKRYRSPPGKKNVEKRRRLDLGDDEGYATREGILGIARYEDSLPCSAENVVHIEDDVASWNSGNCTDDFLPGEEKDQQVYVDLESLPWLASPPYEN